MNFPFELLVSIVALGVSLYALHQGRKHEQIARVPHLDWNQATHRSNEGFVIRMSLRNTGLGPAIIDAYWFLLDGKRFESKAGRTAEELAEICLNGLSYGLKQHGTPGIGSLFPAGEIVCIAEVFFPGLKSEQEEEVRKRLERADFKVDYRSVHGQRFRFTTKD